ncbi:Beta-xylosidase [Dermatophilus congolensis]|uniref:Beta-xylosidase n=1 Tax=Dermatophilus congolensis TaxID=1863 RepID=A0A239VL69_9MICO|nr:cellulase family glycosylhydrolase [Dermatophilus congolensis]SNV22493.1 Beta-xylosidase [Dermatophilus congolensis]
MRRMRSVATWSLTLMLVTFSAMNGQAAPASAASSTTWSQKSGMAIPGTRLAWGPPGQLEHDLDRVAASGVKWLRFDVPWSQISWEPGQADWARFDRIVEGARARGLRPLGVLSTMAPYARPAGTDYRYAPRTASERKAFAGFAKQAAARYKGKINHWEIWNEPNLDQAWSPTPSPAAYVELLRATTPAIKSVNPAAITIAGGTGGATGAPDITPIDWYTGVYAQKPQGLFDALAVHPYSDLRYGWGGEMSTAPIIRAIMDKNGDANKEIWATEAGFPTGGQYRTTENDAARMMRESHAAWTKIRKHGPLFWYTLTDTSDPTSEGHFGFYRLNGTAKPALAVLTALNAQPLPAGTTTPAPPAAKPGTGYVVAPAANLTTNGKTTKATFSLYTTRSVPIRALSMTVRNSAGAVFDIPVRAATTLRGSQTFTATRAALPAGTYTYAPAWQTTNGKWNGPTREGKHTVGATPNTLSAAHATINNTARGATADIVTSVDGKLAVNALIVAMRDSSGANWDIWTAKNTTLTGLQRHHGTKQSLPAGTYTYTVAYQSTDGNWHEQPGKKTLTVH